MADICECDSWHSQEGTYDPLGKEDCPSGGNYCQYNKPGGCLPPIELPCSCAGYSDIFGGPETCGGYWAPYCDEQSFPPDSSCPEPSYGPVAACGLSCGYCRYDEPSCGGGGGSTTTTIGGPCSDCYVRRIQAHLVGSRDGISWSHIVQIAPGETPQFDARGYGDGSCSGLNSVRFWYEYEEIFVPKWGWIPVDPDYNWSRGEPGPQLFFDEHAYFGSDGDLFTATVQICDYKSSVPAKSCTCDDASVFVMINSSLTTTSSTSSSTSSTTTTISPGVCDPDLYVDSVPPGWDGSCCDDESGELDPGYTISPDAPGENCPPGSSCYNNNWIFDLGFESSCCGDDPNENHVALDCYTGDPCVTNPNIGGCCTPDTDCVTPDQSACVPGDTNDNPDSYILGPDGGVIRCKDEPGYANTWWDCDHNNLSCMFCRMYAGDWMGSGCSGIDCWVAEGEEIIFGEYGNGLEPQPPHGDDPGYINGTDVVECCGDDMDESYMWFIPYVYRGMLNGDPLWQEPCNNGACSKGNDEDPNDMACCDDPTDCVFAGSCYSDSSNTNPRTLEENDTIRGFADVNYDGVIGAFCNESEWWDCDTDETHCDEYCSYDWILWQGPPGSEPGEFDVENPGCCGDDSDENFIFLLDYGDPGNTSYCHNIDDDGCARGGALFTDTQCCFEGQCVNDSLCYNPLDIIDIDGDGVAGEICSAMGGNWGGYWVDCDDQSGLCEDPNFCNFSWAKRGETKLVSLGEYNIGFSFKEECCGDDAGEYYLDNRSFQNGSTACCNSSALCAWQDSGGNPSCCHGAEGDVSANCGTCEDLVDNDCDGLVDEWDPDCFLPPVAYASVWNTSAWGDVHSNNWFDNTSNGTGFNIGGYDPSFHGRNATEIVGENFYFTDDNILDYTTNNTTGWSRDQDECSPYPHCRHLVAWGWSFGDGNVTNISGPAQWPRIDGFNHSYSDPGEYNITFRVADNDWDTKLARTNLTVLVGNLPPMAAFNASLNRTLMGWIWNYSEGDLEHGVLDVIVGENITFNGTFSYDQDEGGFNITYYEWDFNDSNITCPNIPGQLSNATGPVAVHRFCDVGVYNVSLYVEDDDNNSGQNIPPANGTTWMLVNATSLRPLVYESAWNDSLGCTDDFNLPPEPKGSNTTYTAFMTEPVYFCDNWQPEGWESRDRDEEGYNISFWNWTVNTLEFNFSEQWPSYSFPSTGNYTVWLNVTDDEGDWNITNMTIEVIDSCGLPCNDTNGYFDTCDSNCSYVCRYCNMSSGVCEFGDCNRSCDELNASSVCVNGCNKCDLEIGHCVADCICPLCELTTMSCPSEGFVDLNFTVNYTVWGAWIDIYDEVLRENLLGWYYDGGVEGDCWAESNVACIYRNFSFDTSCPYGGVSGSPVLVNFSLNCSGIIEVQTCEEIVINPSKDWHSNLACTVQCYDIVTNVSLYFNSTCESDSESSSGYNDCWVLSNASFDSGVFDFECLSGYGPKNECYSLPGVDCSDGGCEYALEGNLTLINVSNNGEYWWTVECSCDYNTAVSEENWTFTIDKEYGN
ncbi:PKD domain-containing protein [Candidatus Altiarchaeota archaeon]